MITDHDLLRRCHTQARSAAGLVRLPLRHQRWRGQSGEQAGFGVGSSMEFQDHRAYIPGDDPRQINWQAYARTGSYTMKQYREEVRPVVDLILDVSGSMTAFADKSARSVESFLWAWESAHQVGASVKTLVTAGGAHALLPDELISAQRWPDSSAGVVSAAQGLRSKVQAATATDSGAPAPLGLDLSRLPLRSGAMRVLVSDLLFPGAPDPVVQALAARSGRGVILVPFSAEEAEPNWDGNYEFIDPESSVKPLYRVDEGLLKSYRSAYKRHFEVWKAAAAKQGVLMARVPAALSLVKALQIEATAVGAAERV
jgi:uncharacterized protein (DUF58 family)